MAEADNFFESPSAVSSDPPPLDAEPSHYGRLKREADGLFAGVTLLNEMEPLDDIDELSLGQSQDYMDRTTLQVATGFLNQLQPASGEGIGCSWDVVFRRFDCESSFPCTSRDIQVHIRHCKFIREFTVKEPSYEALEGYLEQPESKTRIANLQRRCITIQERLRSLPDVDHFLCQLEILPSGELKCQLPGCADWDRIQHDSISIKDHFRRHHCSNFKGAFMPEAIDEINANLDSQLQRPDTAVIMDKIQSDAAQKSSVFTYPGLEYPRLEYPEPEYRWTECHWLEFTSESLSTAHSLEIQKPSWEQLRVLRTLRAKFIVHHRQFLQRTANSSSRGLQELRKTCRRYADLLDTGLLTFKAIMNNESPSSLKEIFAFISLTCAMVGTMQLKGKSISFCLDEFEMRRWRMSLETQRDRAIFDELVPLLWPELNKHLEDGSSDIAIQDVPYAALNYARWSNASVSSLHSTVERLFEESSSDNSFRFEDWLNSRDKDALSLQPGKFDLVGSLHDTSWRSSEMQPQSGPHFRHGDTGTVFDTQNTDSGRDKAVLEQFQSLTRTNLFMQAISFLICEIFRTLDLLPLI